MRHPLISVIIPAYNAETHVHTAVASALNQTYRDLEVIVTDDGSTDDTAAVVASCAAKDPRVRLLRQSNLGVAAARNRAIAAARGELIAPLDADDFWLETKLEAQVQRMVAGGPSMGLVTTWWMDVDERGRTIDLSSRYRAEGRLFELLLYCNFVGNASVPLIRRECLDRVGVYDPSFREHGGEGCEDWDLSLRIADEYDIGVVPRYLSAYRNSSASMSRDVARMARSFELMVGQFEHRDRQIPPDVVRWSRANFHFFLADIAASLDERDAAASNLIKAIRSDPAALTSPRAALLALRLLTRAPTSQATDAPGGAGAQTAGTRAALHDRPWSARLPYRRLRARRWQRLATLHACEPGPPATRPFRTPL